MATRYLVQLIDDLSLEPIPEGAGESVGFGLDGIGYVIDLSDAHVGEFRALLAPYLAAARKAGSVASTRRPQSGAPKLDSKAVREWASANGYRVSERGRVSAEVQQAYAAAH